MARGLLPGAITPEDVITACGGVLPARAGASGRGVAGDAGQAGIGSRGENVSSSKRDPSASLVAQADRWTRGSWCDRLPWRILRISDLSELLTEGGSRVWRAIHLSSILRCSSAFLLSLSPSAAPRRSRFTRALADGRCLKGRGLQARCRFLLVPLTIFVGIVYFGKKSYGAVSILVLLECMAPFALIFEGRKPKARELVLIAALCALAVAGRAALSCCRGSSPWRRW